MPGGLTPGMKLLIWKMTRTHWNWRQVPSFHVLKKIADAFCMELVEGFFSGTPGHSTLSIISRSLSQQWVPSI